MEPTGIEPVTDRGRPNAIRPNLELQNRTGGAGCRRPFGEPVIPLPEAHVPTSAAGTGRCRAIHFSTST